MHCTGVHGPGLTPKKVKARMGGTAEAKESVTKGDNARQRAELAQEQAGSVPPQSLLQKQLT